MIPYGSARGCWRTTRPEWRVWQCHGILPAHLNALEHKGHDGTPEVPQRQQQGYGWPTRPGRGRSLSTTGSLSPAEELYGRVPAWCLRYKRSKRRCSAVGGLDIPSMRALDVTVAPGSGQLRE